MLLPRALTVLVGLPILLAGIYFGNIPFFFLVLGIVILGLREFYFLARETGYACYPAIGVTGGLLVVLSVFLNGLSFGQVTENQGTSSILALALLVIVLYSLWRGPADISLSEWSVTWF